MLLIHVHNFINAVIIHPQQDQFVVTQTIVILDLI